MKKPELLWFEPLDKKKDEETKGLWFYLPEWICRAYRLNSGFNRYRVIFRIQNKKMCAKEGYKKFKKKEKSKYFKENWSRKLNRERRLEKLLESDSKC